MLAFNVPKLSRIRFACILACFFFIPSLAFSQKTYIAIVDIGSSHTDLFVYYYSSPSIKNNLPPTMRVAYQSSVNPGLSSVPLNQFNQNEIEQYAHALFDQSRNQIPPSTPIYLYATGGFRLLDPEKQALYFSYLREYLSQNTSYQVKSTQTISGQHEGLYSWLTVNYLLGYLNETYKKPAIVLEMGGASTQITLESLPHQITPAQDTLEIMIGNKHHRIYSKSYLSLGQNELFKIFSSTPSCLPVQYPISQDGQKGTGQFEQCVQAITDITNGPDYAISSQMKPLGKPAQPVYLLSGFYYQSHSPWIQTGETFVLSDYAKKNQTYCETHWDQIQATPPVLPWNDQLCFRGALHTALLERSYGLENSVKLITKKTLKNQDLSWTLGAALFNVGGGQILY